MNLALLQVPTSGSGVLVYKIDPLHPARGALQENDVVMEIEGVPIADDGTVEFRREERVEFVHEVMTKHIGEHIILCEDNTYTVPCGAFAPSSEFSLAK